MDLEGNVFHYLDDEYKIDGTVRSITKYRDNQVDDDGEDGDDGDGDCDCDCDNGPDVITPHPDHDVGTRTPTPPMNISATSMQSTMTQSMETPSFTKIKVRGLRYPVLNTTQSADDSTEDDETIREGTHRLELPPRIDEEEENVIDEEEEHVIDDVLGVGIENALTIKLDRNSGIHLRPFLFYYKQ